MGSRRCNVIQLGMSLATTVLAHGCVQPETPCQGIAPPPRSVPDALSASQPVQQTSETDACWTPSLEDYGFWEFPNIEALDKLDRDVVSVTGLNSDNANDEFTNVDDLEWLKPIAVRNRIVMIGEDHYIRKIHLLAHRMFFALSQFDNYTQLVLELPYSITPFIDHYAGMTDDAAASDFRQSALRNMVGTAELDELLEHIRRWNKRNPGKRVHIAGYDIEHDFNGTLRRVLVPYLRKLDSSWQTASSVTSIEDVGAQLENARRTLERAGTKRVVGEFAFLTPEYMRSLLANLEMTHLALHDSGQGHQSLLYYRQRALVRNLTDPRFLGTSITKRKAVIWTGAYHAATSPSQPFGGGFLREGVYLNHEFVPTKGRVYSIRMMNIAIEMLPADDVQWDAFQMAGTGYRNIVNRARAAAKAGLVRPGEYYSTDDDDGPLTDLLVKASADLGNRCFRVDAVDWDKLQASAGEGAPSRAVRIQRRVFAKYDCVVVVPQSSLISLNPKDSDP